ncbi:hypothetical protein EDB86DRAFT_3007332 [Lactarius hatsudake]|nr:hypothetical protein EDB86DRAFT_3007332 [Lactarius hatsudake]
MYQAVGTARYVWSSSRRTRKSALIGLKLEVVRWPDSSALVCRRVWSGNIPLMANNPRPAISGYQWDTDTLAAYNIHVQHQDSATFFGMDVDELPLPASLPDDDELLTELEAQDMEDLANKELINLLDLVMEGFEESYVDDFSALLLRRLGYPEDGRVVHTRASNIRLEISGRRKYAQPNICIVDRSHQNCLLLVQENKRFRPGNQAVPQAQLIAEAIAAFTHNNLLLQNAGQETLDVHVSYLWQFYGSCHLLVM